MASIAEGLLEAAQKDLGYREQSDGYTKFGDWYYANVDQSDPYFKTAPWCDMFITWAANQAGMEDYVGEFAYTVDHAKWFKAQGAWGDKPEPGAIVFYDWDGSNSIAAIDHAGIVEKVDEGKISTIEANVDEMWLKRKERDQSKVVGYGLPRKVQANAEGRGAEEQVAVPTGRSEALARPAAFQTAVMTAKPGVAAAPAEAVPLIDTAAVPASILAALLGAVLIVGRKKARQSLQASAAAGRHRRTTGRHRIVAA